MRNQFISSEEDTTTTVGYITTTEEMVTTETENEQFHQFSFNYIHIPPQICELDLAIPFSPGDSSYIFMSCYQIFRLPLYI
jgi:hypothetical protein